MRCDVIALALQTKQTITMTMVMMVIERATRLSTVEATFLLK